MNLAGGAKQNLNEVQLRASTTNFKRPVNPDFVDR
jgi:hypothetical protein